MDGKPRFRRVLLKVSGELLKGDDDNPFSAAALARIAARIGEVADLGVELALVLGAGNIIRGRTAGEAGMDRRGADHMGILATIINALALADALEQRGHSVAVQSALPITGVVAPFDYRQADRLLDDGCILLLAGGTGQPFFTTDTTAALRACQIGAEVILKGTKVNGIYSDDPRKNPNARRYSHITYDEALTKRLRIMDSTAFSLCMDNNRPIVVFDFNEDGVLRRIVQGDFTSATWVSADGAEPQSTDSQANPPAETDDRPDEP